jgi:hypothetical protein
MPYSNLALDADRENGPAARSFAADAHDCIMAIDPRCGDRSLGAGISDGCVSTDNEQPGNISIALLANAAKAILAAARVLPGNQSQPSRELSARTEA